MSVNLSTLTKRTLTELGILALLIFGIVAPFRGRGQWDVTTELIVSTLAASVVLAFRRRFPISVLAVLVVQTLILMSFGVNGPVLGLPVSIVIFQISLKQKSKTGWALVAGAAAVLFTAFAAINGVDLYDPDWIAFISLPAIAIAAGQAMRSRQQLFLETQARLIQMEQNRISQIEKTVAEERLRIARDLHDTIAHEIAVIRLQAELAERAAIQNPSKTAESLFVIRQAAKQVLEQIADLMKALRQSGETNFVESLKDLSSLIAKYEKSDVAVNFEQLGSIDNLPVEIDKVAFRVVQEGLTNATKHSADGRVNLTITNFNQQLRVKMTNVVKKENDQMVQSGFGLVGLRERVQLVGGSLSAEPNQEQVFELSAVLPTRSEASN
jgi:signal transduction histidine kinase